MDLFQKKIERIKNVQRQLFSKDFNYNAVSFLVFGFFIAAGVVLQLNQTPAADLEDIYMTAGGMLVAAAFVAGIPMWIILVQMIIVIWIVMMAFIGPEFYPFATVGSAGLLFSASIQLVYQWDKVVILRVGRFRKVHGPGLFFILPLLDRVASVIDTRIRATDFTAEKTLTKDTVPVHVDALAFWMIWDARQAVLEVENYMEAVTLSAQTALRDSIGKHALEDLLSERDELGREIQRILDAKTNPWGVTVLSIEITDIIIPKELENAMSKQAQAERERKSRVILGDAEVEIAEKFEKAAEKYRDNPVALQLRAMNMVYEGIRNNSNLMLLPSSALDNMNLGAVMGTAAYSKTVQYDEKFAAGGASRQGSVGGTAGHPDAGSGASDAADSKAEQEKKRPRGPLHKNGGSHDQD
ncbi:MAG: slipin family protein [Sediminispirochaetaceae bacterium]